MKVCDLLIQNRIRAYNAQSGRCCYCKWPMWEKSIEPECDALKRMRWFRHLDEHQNLRTFECTAEHIQRRADLGRNSAENIAAACSFCNSSRADRSTEQTAVDAMALNNLVQVGRDNHTDEIIFETMKIKRDFYYKFQYFLFVNLEPWIATGHAMTLDNTSKAGNFFKVIESNSLVFPSANEKHKSRAMAYSERVEFPGSVIMLQNIGHYETLCAELAKWRI